MPGYPPASMRSAFFVKRSFDKNCHIISNPLTGQACFVRLILSLMESSYVLQVSLWNLNVKTWVNFVF